MCLWAHYGYQKCSDVNPCSSLTDIHCVVCKKWFCEQLLIHCIICEEAACQSCWYEERCCLQERGTTAKHLRAFYEDKTIGVKGFGIVGEQYALIDERKDQGSMLSLEIRVEAGSRSITSLLDQNRERWKVFMKMVSANIYAPSFVGRCFPAVTSSNKKSILHFMRVLSEFEGVDEKSLFSFVMIYSKDKESILDLVTGILRDNEGYWYIERQ